MKQDLDIIYILNDNYWIPVLVSAKSAVLCRHSHLDDGKRLHFHLIVDNVVESHIRRIVDELTTACSCVSIKKVDSSFFGDMPEWHGSKLVWSRCKINRLLPNVHGWACVCDGDTLWFKDPGKLFALMSRYPPEVSFCGSRDRKSTDDASSAWFVQHGLSCPESKYVCMGFAMLNMDWLKEFDIESKSAMFIRQYGIPPWFEQDIFNFLLLDHKNSLPLGWGTSPIHGLRNIPEDQLAVVHYWGALPWPASIKRRMLDIHVPWWHLASCLLNVYDPPIFAISHWRWLGMRMMTHALQLLPCRILSLVHRSAKQVPFDYTKAVTSYNKEFKNLRRGLH